MTCCATARTVATHGNRKHPQIGNFTLYDCLIDYNGKTCRMELAFDVNHYISELRSTRDDLSAEKKLVACIENLIMATDFDVAVNVMLKMINEHYAAIEHTYLSSIGSMA